MYAMAMSSAERYRKICVVLAQKQIFLHLSTGQSPRTQKTAGFLSLHCGVNQSTPPPELTPKKNLAKEEHSWKINLT